MCFDISGFGKELQFIRKELNLTIEEASFLAGINEKTIYRIEHGKNKISRKTLDKLSIAYKKDLIPIYNKYVLNPQMFLSDLIFHAEESLYIDNIEGIETSISELEELRLNQFMSYDRLFIEYYKKLLEATYIDLKYSNRVDAINLLLDSIKFQITDFQIFNYKNFNYSPIEKRILMNLLTMEYDFYEDEICVEILHHLLTLSNYDRILYPKISLNLSTIYHKKGNYRKSLYFTEKGIMYCIKNKSLDVLPKLFFRKFSSELILEIGTYKESLNKAIFTAEINNQEFLKKRFTTSAEKFYGVKLD